MKSTGLFFTAFAFFILLLITILCTLFNASLANHLKESVGTNMEELSQPLAASFEMQMTEQIKKVYTMADFFAHGDELGSESHRALLQSAVKNNGLLRCAISFPDGTFITHDNKTGIVINDDFFIRAMAGEFNISDPRPSVVDETKTVILFTCPIERDGRILGALTYSYLCTAMDEIFNFRFYGGQGLLFITKKNGNMLMGNRAYFSENENLLENLKKACAHVNHAESECISLTKDKDAFILHLKNGNKKLYVNYSELKFNDWYLLCIVPEKTAESTIRFVTRKQWTLGAIIFVSVMLYIVSLVLFWVFRRKNIDKLTGANTFENFRRSAVKIIQNHPSQRFIIVKLDVKNFKLINRIYNFDEGDRLIKNMAAALKVTLTEDVTTFARINTDTFILLLPYINRYRLNLARKKFIETFKDLMGESFTAMVEFPTGQYITTEKDSIKPDITEIFEKANFAHRIAKQSNSELIIDYDEVLEKEAIFQKTIEDKMHDALAAGEFALYLQPKFLTRDETMCGAEALVRWQVGDRLIFHPADFVPVFEKNGFIVKIDMYMYELTVKKIREILDAGFTPCPISVNFSRFHLNNTRFVDELCAVADKYSVPHEFIEIELTESVVFNNLNLIVSLLEKLHKNGFSLAMDDFGSGYSSLGLLKNLEINVMKIDQSFFHNSADEGRAVIVIKNILNMAKELQIKTVAEGVETKEQVEMLRNFGCDIIQGFYYSKPMSAADFSAKYFFGTPIPQ